MLSRHPPQAEFRNGGMRPVPGGAARNWRPEYPQSCPIGRPEALLGCVRTDGRAAANGQNGDDVDGVDKGSLVAGLVDGPRELFGPQAASEARAVPGDFGTRPLSGPRPAEHLF